MSEFNPNKLHVTFCPKLSKQTEFIPRKYTLTHSDLTGDLFLAVGPEFDFHEIHKFYTKLMRDEVLGEWIIDGNIHLLIHCHVSGGFVFGPARWRNSIFKNHLPMALNAICYGDRKIIATSADMQNAAVLVQFHARQKSLERTENWGKVFDYL